MTLELQLARTFLEEHPRDAAIAIERLAPADRVSVLRDVPSSAARALAEMMPAAASESIGRLTPDEAAALFASLRIDTSIAILRRMPPEALPQLLALVADDRRAQLLRGLEHAEGTAGALMDPGVLALPADITVGDARVRLRREPRGLLYYLFVVERDLTLVGVLDIPELMRASAGEVIRHVMHTEVERLPAWTPAVAIRAHPGWRAYHAMPVVDDAGRLMGAIRYQTLKRLEHEAESGSGEERTSVATGALGELFHLGLAGFVEAVAGVASPRHRRAREDEGSR